MKKIIFFNTAWMDRYQGITNDKMKGGGGHVEKYGWGGEMFNFKPYQNRVFGYVQVGGKININRIGASNSDDKIEGVTVVWIAKRPASVGNYIIGWYENATVFREEQRPKKISNRKWGKYEMGYFVSTTKENSKLLVNDERTVRIPRGKGGMGQKNIWYADNNPEFAENILNYIKTGIVPHSSKSTGGSARQNDPLKRIEVEKNAIKKVTKHYEKLGYQVKSVEKDNVGWDLIATNGTINLKLEVKGLSGKEIATELTPNEYFHLKKDKSNYRLCIVVEALTSPKLMNFSYSVENNNWICENGRILNFEEKISARVF